MQFELYIFFHSSHLDFQPNFSLHTTLPLSPPPPPPPLLSLSPSLSLLPSCSPIPHTFTDDKVLETNFVQVLLEQTRDKLNGRRELWSSLVYSWSRLQPELQKHYTSLTKKIQDLDGSGMNSFQEELEYLETLQSQFNTASQGKEGDIEVMVTSFAEAVRVAKVGKLRL